MPSRRAQGVSSAVFFAAAVVACAAPQATSEPTIPERPAVPEQWHVVTSDAGDVSLTLPPDFEAIFTAAGVMAQPPMLDGSMSIEVLAAGPADVPQPANDGEIGSWLNQSTWVPRAGEGGLTSVGPVNELEVALPAGRAMEVDMTVNSGLPDAARVLVYAIATERGIAIVRIVGRPQAMEDRADDLRLIAMLAEFGDPR
jgi:hypothetical protein